METNNQETGKYFMEAELAFRNYEPQELKVGMTFLYQITDGIPEPVYDFFTLREVPEDHHAFMAKYGTPVHMFVIQADNDAEVLALPMNIGLLLVGDEEDCNYVPLTDSDINRMLNDYDGYIDILCEEDGTIIHQGEKVILSLPDEWVDGEEEDEEE